MLSNITTRYRQWQAARSRRRALNNMFDEKQVERNMRVNGIKPQAPDYKQGASAQTDAPDKNNI